MPIDAIIRVSFESRPQANQAVNSALVGHPQEPVGPGPFQRVGTAVYACSGAPEQPVGQALAELGAALNNYSYVLDFVGMSLIKRT